MKFPRSDLCAGGFARWQFRRETAVCWRCHSRCNHKTNFADHVLENMFSNTQEKPPPKPLATENHSREEPVRLPRSKDNQDNMIAATQLKKTRHKFVTETGSFRSAPRRCLKASGPLALKRNPPLQRTEARFTSSPSFFYRPRDSAMGLNGPRARFCAGTFRRRPTLRPRDF